MNKTHILVSEYQAIDAAGTSVPLIQPANLMDFGSYARQVTFMVRVAAVTGAPTAWSLGVKFQYGFPSTDGYQYQTPQWADLEALHLTSDIAEGAGWFTGSHPRPTGGEFGVVADQTDTLPIAAKRTLRNFGLRCRVVLEPKFTGGTNPAIKATVLAVTGD